jgi:biotin carboxyl carrier protein
VVQRLCSAGAIPVGKTNLDQFATGLNGTRSPYGAPACVFNLAYVSGGSSSGSAVVVAAGLVPFALGTDTAGSGRVPAAFNGLVGHKPSKGRWSTTGLVPACRSLDCITVPDGCEVIEAPFGGVLWSWSVAAGTVVEAGQTIAVIEAMKMESPVLAPCAGTVHTLFVAERQPVTPGAALLAVEPA